MQTTNYTRLVLSSCKLGFIFIAVLLLCVLAPRSAWADVRLADIVMGESVQERGLSVSQCPNVDAQFVYVCDENGVVYFQRDSEAQAQIASVTKIMTAIVALENAPLNTIIKVSAAAATIGESTASLWNYDELTLDQALIALLVSSGNDAAQAIAENLGAQWVQDGQTSVQAFAQKMNEQAQKLGMTNTYFENPHGLDFYEFAGSLHSTAHDVAIMSAYAMKNEIFRDIVCQDSAVITVTRDNQQTPLELTSTDELLGVYEGACGIKTGFTALAGACFAGACNRGDGMLYAIVLNSADESQRFRDCTELWDWVYKHRVEFSLAHSSEFVSTTMNGSTRQVPVVAEVAHTGWMNKRVKGTLANPEETVSIFDLDGNVSQEVTYKELTEDVKVGDVIGSIAFKQHNKVIATSNIVACENVAAPNLFEGISIWLERLASSFSGAQTVAQSRLINELPLLVKKNAAAS